ncbi:helix-turn-helix transcriptional regulator [Streptomyces sp. NPDC086777]|uniref:helix-turn-helix transcriptional regulator n=1 Tax=Streptomyces sp. NPDC086777 TaxID=3154866 RepID=UPI00344D6EED
MAGGVGGFRATAVHRVRRELRKRRLEAGLSLTALSGSVHYSKAQLSKVERGLKAPSRDLARLCDADLGAGGALLSLLVPETTDPPVDPAPLSTRRTGSCNCRRTARTPSSP